MSPDPRTETIRFRCTPAEVEDFERAAAADQRTVSDWLRFVASRASTNVPVIPVASPEPRKAVEDTGDPKKGLAPSRGPAPTKAPPPAKKAPGKAGQAECAHKWQAYPTLGLSRCAVCKAIKR
jgi:hypothetical protein